MMKRIADILKNRRALGGVAAFAAAVVIGGTAMMTPPAQDLELPSFVEPLMNVVEIEEPETPLAAPKVTTKTTKKTTKKNVKMKTAAKKTYTEKLPATKKTTKKTTNSTKQTVTTETTVVTNVTNKYTKKSKVKVVTTATTTTVKTTTVLKATPTPTPKPQKTYTEYKTTARALAPKMDSRVINAFETLGFVVIVKPKYTSSGYYDTKNQSITLKAEQLESFPDTIYHELGHFIAFIAGNVDMKADFAAIYNAEKGLMTGVNAAYARQSASEYFAESVKEYVVDNATVKAKRPKTYAAITAAINSITDARVQAYKKMYASVWK